jgi:hypothetical protein
VPSGPLAEDLGQDLAQRKDAMPLFIILSFMSEILLLAPNQPIVTTQGEIVVEKLLLRNGPNGTYSHF